MIRAVSQITKLTSLSVVLDQKDLFVIFKCKFELRDRFMMCLCENFLFHFFFVIIRNLELNNTFDGFSETKVSNSFLADDLHSVKLVIIDLLGQIDLSKSFCLNDLLKLLEPSLSKTSTSKILKSFSVKVNAAGALSGDGKDLISTLESGVSATSFKVEMSVCFDSAVFS